ncbi:hypothetical protein [Limosilactobacillus fermentum]|uniref:hypothetical protein n=1 Tax=Limosilactobacillus fermentum TaxID=1613 RepID=UPI003558C12A
MANGDISMSDFMQQWLEEVKDISVNLTPEEQAKITEAGAEVMAEKLTAVTNAKHRSRHNDKVYGHAADHITHMAKDVDGETNGASTVGWDNHYHAMNMMRLNDGYKGYTGDHFVTNLQQDKATSEAVLKAESDKYQELINDKRGDGD